MTDTIKVLITPAGVLGLLRLEAGKMNDLENNTNNVFAQERIACKRQAIEDGIEALYRAVERNPDDTDASYDLVIEEFSGRARGLSTEETGNGIKDARTQGRSEGIKHVLHRLRTARG